MCFIKYFSSALLACIIFHSTSGQKISAVGNEVNKTVSINFIMDDVSETSHQLTCLPDWQHPPPRPTLSWDVTNAPMAVDGVDFVKSNGSVTTGILWLSFLKVSSNITGTYVCIVTAPNGTSYTNFEVSVNDGLSITGIIAIAVGSLILAVGALTATVVAAKRFHYISM